MKRVVLKYRGMVFQSNSKRERLLLCFAACAASVAGDYWISIACLVWLVEL